ncbi:MAG: phosphoribosyltransferase [Acetobacteraceae bacterium]|nr:phosphoribosyltransferase [Acetobacteraceae bacterium]MDW8398124.1 phosphoribosyltransferase [Acetobacteraceae bacterium]
MAPSPAEPWQGFDRDAPPPPWTDRLPAPMPDGTVLALPIRDYGEIGVGGLIANQAAIPVVKRLAGWMAEAARGLGAEVVVGLPTLGQVFAPLVAESFGHANWVAPGYSRKRWYDEWLSVPIASSTAPDARSLWLDPRLLPRLSGRRALVVDDVLSTGASARAGLALLARAGVAPVGLCVAMVQGDRWQAEWPDGLPVAAAFATPILIRAEGGWMPDPARMPRGVLLPGGGKG